ncbi:MAG: DUF2130 domain-containing protein [Thermoplasmatales archaeon]|jgi:hypothetical protein|nr:DUF2130 domain-containing protein [Candidatus Thermoplasmatota archaeon]MCL6003590.1 DUF2130 domain-containing protein [Candidatus Thermoplasmatota archaeon]MDA8054765.1 DUF2130 domain-containing protein [Thermoplasmatales archaeon]
MADDTVTCPNCGAEIPVTAALRESIESKANELYERKLGTELEKRLLEEREKMKEKINEEFNSKLTEMEDRISIKEKHLQEARKMESEERKKRIEMEENAREQRLALERQMEDEKKRIQERLRKEYDQEYNLERRENQQKIDGLMKKVQELNQKLEQGSQQIQGEVLEEELEDRVRGAFTFDSIIPIPQGTKGPDLIQTVRNAAGVEAGKIAWEAKRTKEWNDEWIGKLKEDLVKYDAEVGIIVTKTLPKDIATFGMRNGILITNFESAIPLALIARTNLTEIARQKRLGESSNETRDILYRYLTSTQFRQRVEAVADGIIRMRSDIETERRSMERIWAKRTKEIERTIGNFSGMFGDLQGILGTSLQNVRTLSLSDDNEEE